MEVYDTCADGYVDGDNKWRTYTMAKQPKTIRVLTVRLDKLDAMLSKLIPPVVTQIQAGEDYSTRYIKDFFLLNMLNDTENFKVTSYTVDRDT